MRRTIFALITSIISLTIAAQDIAQWRGPNRNGIYNETGLMKKWPDTGPKMLWHFDELGEGYSSAAVTSTGIYTTGMINGTGYVFALDLNGKLLWKKEYGKEWNESQTGARSTPLVIKEKLYILSAYGKLTCMNSTNGQTIWSVDFMKEHGARNLTWGITENLLYDGNMIFCTPGGRDVNVVALDRHTGKIIWKSKGSGELSGYCSPVIINLSKRKLLVTMMERSIHGFDASTGSLLWKFGHINEYSVHPNVPVYIDGYLYCTIGYGIGGVMLKVVDDGSAVTRVWKNTRHDPKIGGFVVLNGRIYGGGDYNRKFFCLDWKTGNILYEVNQLAPSNIISNDGLLYIYTERGTVDLVEPRTDNIRVISSFRVPLGSGPHWAHLVINNKLLYVRHGNSLMVYDIANFSQSGQAFQILSSQEASSV